MKKPVRVAVTGAAGQIGYSLLYRIASGEMLGKDQPVILQMLELPMEKAQAALKGVMMELEDCAFPLLAGMVGTDDPEVAFKDADYALLVGARPRGPGMERKDLLLENAKIFTAQGAALNGLAVGQPVRVFVQTRQKVKGIAVPVASLMKNPANQTVVWVKTAPERFEPRAVTTEALDGLSVAVTAGLKPGDRVVEFASFGQYFTTLLSPIVGEKGLIYMYDLPYTEARAGAASRDFVAKHPNSRYELVDYNDIKLPQNVDIVFNVLYYHDLSINKTDVAVLNKKVLDSLKPGGIYIVLDHQIAKGQEFSAENHRIDEAKVKAEVLAAGFEYVGSSTVLHNTTDDGTKTIFDPSVRGKTNQFILKFKKPG